MEDKRLCFFLGWRGSVGDEQVGRVLGNVRAEGERLVVGDVGAMVGDVGAMVGDVGDEEKRVVVGEVGDDGFMDALDISRGMSIRI